MANSLMQLVPEIYPIDLEDIRCAVSLFQTYGPKGITARDVLHAAVMMNRGLKEILSTDFHFDLIEGITRVDPEHLFLHRKSNK
jgi:predicted nucleic acid-binding protein